ncbi:MAG: hypothetical protein RLZZ414_1110, partial [Bacteroidota bacterium]
ERINFISNDINKVSISVQNPQNYTLVGDTTVLVCSNGNVVLQLNNTQFIDTIMWTGTGLVGNHYNNQLSLNNVTGNKLYTANIGNGSCNKSLNFKVNEQIVATPQIQNIASLVFKNDNPINLSGTPTGGMFTGKGVTNGVFNPTQAGLGKASITYTITENKCSKSANIQTIVYDTTQTTCNDTILVSVDDTLVINFLITTVNPVKNTSVKVYPNPATTSINIEFEDFNQLDNYKVEFLNSVGQLIQTININNSLEVIDVSNLSKGIYFLQISNPSGNIKANKKIVIN